MTYIFLAIEDIGKYREKSGPSLFTKEESGDEWINPFMHNDKKWSNLAIFHHLPFKRQPHEMVWPFCGVGA